MSKNFFASVSYNTAFSSRAITSYRIMLHEDDRTVTGQLQQNGPVCNNSASYSGVFATKRAAVEALADYINAPFLLVEDGRGDVILQSADQKPRGRVLARRPAADKPATLTLHA